MVRHCPLSKAHRDDCTLCAEQWSEVGTVACPISGLASRRGSTKVFRISSFNCVSESHRNIIRSPNCGKVVFFCGIVCCQWQAWCTRRHGSHRMTKPFLHRLTKFSAFTAWTTRVCSSSWRSSLAFILVTTHGDARLASGVVSSSTCSLGEDPPCPGDSLRRRSAPVRRFAGLSGGSPRGLGGSEGSRSGWELERPNFPNGRFKLGNDLRASGWRLGLKSPAFFFPNGFITFESATKRANPKATTLEQEYEGVGRNRKHSEWSAFSASHDRRASLVYDFWNVQHDEKSMKNPRKTTVIFDQTCKNCDRQNHGYFFISWDLFAYHPWWQRKLH